MSTTSTIRDFYTIASLAADLGVSYHTVYYYITRGLVEPIGYLGNQKVFDSIASDRLRLVIEYRKRGYPIKMIKDMLEGEGTSGE